MSVRCVPRCLNGGICVESPGGFVCNCTSNFYGDTCQNQVTKTVTFVLIFVALSFAIIVCIGIALYQRCREDEERPNFISRIISVRTLRRRTTNIDKSKNDIPPNYDEIVLQDDEVADKDIADTTNENEESAHSPVVVETSLKDETVLPTQSVDDTGTRDELLNYNAAECPVAEPASMDVDLSDVKEDEEKENGIARSQKNAESTPPDYTDVQQNRASQMVHHPPGVCDDNSVTANEA